MSKSNFITIVDAYPPDWPNIAKDIKDKAGWRCEHCNHRHDHETGHTLTVHHLNGIKSDCRFNNLVALCQRCHLHIQAKYRPGQLWLTGKPEWATKRNL